MSASSSSKDPPPKTIAAKAAKPDKEPVFLTKVPHTGRIVLSKPVGQATTFVVDTVALHRQPLPPGQWTLEEVDGFMAIVDESTDEGQVLLLEDIVTKQLCKGKSSDDLYVVSTTGGKQSRLNLTQRMERFKDVSANIFVGPLRSKLCLQGYQMLWPRANNCRYIWSLIDIYKLLKFTTYGGKASMWAYDNLHRWQTHVDKVGGQGDNFFTADSLR